MEDINGIYKFIGKYLVSNIQSKDWKKIILNMEVNDRYRGFDGAYFDCMDVEHDLGIAFSFEFGKKIKELYQFTKEHNFAPFTRWRRAVISTWSLYGIRHYKTDGTNRRRSNCSENIQS